MIAVTCMFLLALLFMKKTGYMTKEDYAGEIERMSKKITAGDELVINLAYNETEGGLKGEVTIDRIKAGTSYCDEIDRSKPFFVGNSSVPQNYFRSQRIYRSVLPFSVQLESILRLKGAKDVLNNVMMLSDDDS